MISTYAILCLSNGLVADRQLQYGIRFQNNEQAETFVYQMAEEVSRRLKSVDMRGRSLTLKVLVRDPKAPVEAPKVTSSFYALFMASSYLNICSF